LRFARVSPIGLGFTRPFQSIHIKPRAGNTVIPLRAGSSKYIDEAEKLHKEMRLRPRDSNGRPEGFAGGVAETPFNLMNTQNQMMDFTDGNHPELMKDQDPRDYRARFYCILCLDGYILDPMNLPFIQENLTADGLIPARSDTLFCRRHQHQFTRVVKRARKMGLINYKKNQFNLFHYFDKFSYTGIQADKVHMSQQEMTNLFSSRVIKNPQDDQVPSLEGQFASNWDVEDVNLRSFSEALDSIMSEIGADPQLRAYVDDDGVPRSLDPEKIPVADMPENDPPVVRKQPDPEVDHYLIDYVNQEEAETDQAWEQDENGRSKMTAYMEHPPAGKTLQTFDSKVFEAQLKADIAQVIRERYIPSGMSVSTAAKVEMRLNKMVEEKFEETRRRKVDLESFQQ